MLKKNNYEFVLNQKCSLISRHFENPSYFDEIVLSFLLLEFESLENPKRAA